MPVFHVHSDETFTTFLRDTDKSTGGAIRRAIVAGAMKAREEQEKASTTAPSSSSSSSSAAADANSKSRSTGTEPIDSLCDVESRISFTLPLKLPRRGGGLNYLDFRNTQPEHCDEGAHRKHLHRTGGNSRSGSGSSSRSSRAKKNSDEDSTLLSALDRHPKWSEALASMLGPVDRMAKEAVQVRPLHLHFPFALLKCSFIFQHYSPSISRIALMSPSSHY